jgi:uncharacterized membrane protein YhaH (DUF805 family)
LIPDEKFFGINRKRWEKSMDFMNLFLGFEGRINRQPFWLGLLAMMILTWILEFVLFSIFGVNLVPVDPSATPEVAAAAAMEMMNKMALPLGLLFLITLWPALAIYTKRWHDRDKSGWWSLIMFVPIIGAIWFLIECGFLRGTDGPNRFGNDPLDS